MKVSPLFSTPAAIVLGAILIVGSIYLKPSSGTQALYGDGYVYVVDLHKKNIANIIPGKTVHRKRHTEDRIDSLGS